MIFKDSISYPDIFQVSDCGVVKSKRTGIILKQNLHSNGYYTIATKIGGRKGRAVCIKVHRLVAEVYCDNNNDHPIVNHIDGVKTNNYYLNLEWCTYSYNAIHAFKTGLSKVARGVNCSSSSLTKRDVEWIKSNYIKGSKIYGCSALSVKFSVHHTTISRVTRGETYKDLL